MTVLIIPLANPYVTPRERTRFSMNWRSSDGSPLGSVWPFLVHFRSSLLTSGTTPASSSEATSSSASGSQTPFGSAPVPSPATEPLGDHVHSADALAGAAMVSAP